jgi:hypothetical protein
MLLQITGLPGFGLDVWEQAAKSIVENTNAASAYVMVVAPALEPEYVFPEENDEAPESDDEQAAPVPVQEEPEPQEAPDVEAKGAEAVRTHSANLTDWS